jgi:hypothetical protein
LQAYLCHNHKLFAYICRYAHKLEEL